MKAIFLDIDGVLNTPSSESRCGEYIGIGDDKTERLADIVKRANAEIVIVSTWKKYWRKDEKLKPLQDYSATYLDEKLKKFGIKAVGKTKIRANYGHFFPVNLSLKSIKPPDILYHGTAKGSVNGILSGDVKKSKRNFVHLSDDYFIAYETGKRHGKPVAF